MCLVHLMRIGESGAERPVARIDAPTYVDVADVVTDLDQEFFGSGGLDRVRPLVSQRASVQRRIVLAPR
jgi:hypothetical protein